MYTEHAEQKIVMALESRRCICLETFGAYAIPFWSIDVIVLSSTCPQIVSLFYSSLLCIFNSSRTSILRFFTSVPVTIIQDHLSIKHSFLNCSIKLSVWA